jgi:hypothetical protein
MSPLKSEAGRFSERNQSVAHPVRATPRLLIGCLETNCQRGNESHPAVGIGGTGVGFFQG